MQERGLYILCTAIISLIIISNAVPVHGQIGGIISSTTGTVGTTTSSITGTVNSTVSSTTSTTSSTVSSATDAVGGIITNVTDPTGIVNSTLSTNVTDTNGSLSLANPLGLPLPFTITTINASSSVAGVQVFGNGTIVTSMNGVAAKFFFDPNTVPQSPTSSNKVVLTVKTDDLSGSQVPGLWTELDSPKGSLINNGYSPKSYAVTPQKEYLVKVFDNKKYIFNHWSDGSTNRTRSIILTQDTVLTAYYSSTSPTISNSTLLTVKTVDLAGNQITGLWNELHLPDGSFVNAGYSPKSYAVTSGKAYVVDATNWRKYVFNHWGDGSTNPAKPVSLTQDTVLTAYYTTGTTTPSAPTNLSATAISSSQINLSWSAPSSGRSTITGYQVERSSDSGSTWSTIMPNTATTATTYSDTGLATSTAYAYRVSAINSAGTSPPSNTASATTLGTSGNPSNIALNNVQSTSGATSTSNQITLSNFDSETGNDRLLVVGISANNNDVASVTFGGVLLTNIAHSFINNDAEFWYLVHPNGTGDVVVTMNGPAHAVIGAYSFSGVNQTLPIPTHAVRHNTNPNSPSVTITTKYPNDWVLDLPSMYGGSTLGSPTCTQEWNVGISNQITGASSYVMVPAPSAVTCGWTASTGDMWDDDAIEIKSAG